MLAYCNTSSKEGSISHLNPNERKVNQQKIKSDVCANRFYTNIEEQKYDISKYLDNKFGRWSNDIYYDT